VRATNTYGAQTGHRYLEKDHVKITLPGHGPGDLTKKHVGMILRQLEHMGMIETQFAMNCNESCNGIRLPADV
jgi:hypothetical protein